MLHYCLFEKSVFKFLHYKWMSVISLSQFGVRRAGGSRIVPSTRVRVKNQLAVNMSVHLLLSSFRAANRIARYNIYVFT